MSFITGFFKIAVIDMASDAAILANAPMQTAVPGASLDKGTAQGERKLKRTMNENKKIPSSYMAGWPNARNMGPKEN
jgi:hypothetical protein